MNKFLVNTGSQLQTCQIDEDVFMTIEKRPPLKPCILSLTTADGRDMIFFWEGRLRVTDRR